MIFRNSKRYLQIIGSSVTKSRGTQYNSSMKLFSRTISQKNPGIEYQLSDPGNLGELSGNLSYLSQVWFEVKKCYFFSPKWCFATRNNTIFSFLMSDFTNSGCWQVGWVHNDESKSPMSRFATRNCAIANVIGIQWVYLIWSKGNASRRPWERNQWWILGILGSPKKVPQGTLGNLFQILEIGLYRFSKTLILPKSNPWYDI